MHTITKEQLEQALAHRINEAEAELQALKAVAINTNHKTLTNRAVWSERDGVSVKIGDYSSIGKALYVYYQAGHRYQSTDITAYTYNNPDGTEIGVEGFVRISRTLTPAELQKSLDDIIEGRKKSLKGLKADLVNAEKIVSKHNKIANDLTALENSVTWATRGVMR